ncbi:MAG: ribonuclease H-like domain-containing protein [Planctomycetes bacterium]|nr:ribonuclease H-like domain-containing protein [Planctomycetota bacterium]MCC7396003.1 ribonuclease H-like domain-containing protein [Planctomycetota bacterium]
MNDDENRTRIVLASNLAALRVAEHEWDVYATLRSIKELQTKDGRPFLVLELADVHTCLEAKVWDDAKEAMAAAKLTAAQGVVKVRGAVKDYQGKPQLIVRQLRALAAGERPDGFDPSQLVDPAMELVEDLCCRTLVFDIETVPAFDRRELPPTVAEALSDNATRKEMEPAAVMGMSPFFGKVVSLAIGDGDADADGATDEVTVLAVPPEGFLLESCPPWLRLMDEADLLRAFWALASRAETVVSFNGRGFDIPFLVTRSLIHGIPARVDLMSQRFALRPHLDLFELVSQRGRGPSKLDVVCWALGIESPKEVMDGSMVAPAYAAGEIVKIAEYNAHDVRATSAVYRKCRDLVLRYRADWAPSRR